MKKSLFLLFFVFFSVGIQGGPDFLIPQEKSEQKPLQHEVAVTLKLIQVYVTDKDGKPVTDLSREDFVVTDNGQQVRVADFEKHLLTVPQIKTKTEPIKKELAPPLERMNRKFFLFFDFTFNNPTGLQKAKNAALHFIDAKLQPEDEVGIFSYSTQNGLDVHQFLTTDHNKIQELVEGLRAKDYLDKIEQEKLFEGYQSVLESLTTINKDKASYGGKTDETIKIDVDHSDRMKRLLRRKIESDRMIYAQKAVDFSQKMKELAKGLRYIPGYKHMLLFSSGIIARVMYRKTPPKSEGFRRDEARKRYEEMTKELAASNCHLYCVDTTEPDAAISGEFDLTGGSSLQRLSQVTGGKYFGSVRDYENIMAEVHNITGSYYVLGYYINERWDGKYHKVKVEVKRKGCEVHAQGGYFNPKPFAKYSDFEKGLHLIDLALNENPIFQDPVVFPLEISPGLREGKSFLKLNAEITSGIIERLGKKKAEAVALIFDEQDNVVEFKRKEEDFTKNELRPYVYAAEFEVPPGTYRCCLVLRNLETGRGAVARVPVVIPDSTEYGIELEAPEIIVPEREVSSLSGLTVEEIQTLPFTRGLPQGITRFQILVKYTVTAIPEPEIGVTGSLIKTLTGEEMLLSILEKDRIQERNTQILLLEIYTKILQPGQYNLGLHVKETQTLKQAFSELFFRVRSKSRDAYIGELIKILDGSGDYCELLAHASLNFVCRERIEDIRYTNPRYIRDYYKPGHIRTQEEKDVYVYDYQLIKKGDEFKENRILMEENGKGKYVKNATLKPRRFYSQRSVLGPIGLMSLSRQDQYIYSIVKEDSDAGREAVVIEVLPREKNEGSPNYGKIWVDKENFSILKIGVAQESLAGIDKIKNLVWGGKVAGNSNIKVVHFYNELYQAGEGQIIRFPSKTQYEEHYTLRKIKDILPITKTLITYTDYKFFTVDVDVKY